MLGKEDHRCWVVHIHSKSFGHRCYDLLFISSRIHTCTSSDTHSHNIHSMHRPPSLPLYLTYTTTHSVTFEPCLIFPACSIIYRSLRPFEKSSYVLEPNLDSPFETRLQIHPAMIAQMVKRLSLKMAPPCEVSCCNAFVANDLAYCYVFPVENI